MNNKGFTLAELLAIVVILSVIMVLAAPNLGKQIQKNEENTSSVLSTKIENASKLYISKYYAKRVVDCMDGSITGTSCDIKFKLDDLQRDGLLSLKGNDGCKDGSGGTKNTIAGDIIVSISLSSIEYDFSNISNFHQCYNCVKNPGKTCKIK